jgi:hypothetical protein
VLLLEFQHPQMKNTVHRHRMPNLLFAPLLPMVRIRIQQKPSTLMAGLNGISPRLALQYSLFDHPNK